MFRQFITQPKIKLLTSYQILPVKPILLKMQESNPESKFIDLDIEILEV